MERYGVSFRIQSECAKIGTRETPNTDTIHAVCNIVKEKFTGSEVYSEQGLRVPFVVSCCKFLKSVILKTFSEIILAFLSVESKKNIVYGNIDFTGNLFFGFGRYCG